MKLLCAKCEKRLMCTTLCRKAEVYTNQDFRQKKRRTHYYHNLDGFVLQPHGKYKRTSYNFLGLEDDYSENSAP